MKKTILTIGILFIIVNVIAGLTMSVYPLFNMAVNTAVIAITTMLTILSTSDALKMGFRVSLPFVMAVVGLVQLILGCVMPPMITDNWCFLLAVLLLAFEVLLLIIAKSVSKIN